MTAYEKTFSERPAPRGSLSAASIALGVSALVNSAAVVIMGFGIDAIWQQAKDIGKIEETTNRLQLAFDALGRKFDTRQNSTDKKLDTIQSSIDTLRTRLDNSQADIGPLLTKLGVPASDVVGTWIGDEVVFFPKTMAARERFIRAGYQQVDINPVLYGFRPPLSQRKIR